MTTTNNVFFFDYDVYLSEMHLKLMIRQLQIWFEEAAQQFQTHNK